MTAICMVVGGSAARRDEVFTDLLAAQPHHGEVRPGCDHAGARFAARAKSFDSDSYEDPAIAVLVTGYLVEFTTDGHLQGLGDQSPAEWLAQRWLETGPAALDAVDGDYAALVLDKRARRLYAIAGPTVIYPLFVARAHDDDSQWVLGAEPKTVLQAAGRRPEMNAEAMVQHLFYLGTLFDPTASPFEGVKRIPAGCYASWRLDAPRQYEQHTFWDPAAIPLQPGRSRDELLQGLRSAIEESVLHALPSGGSSMLALSGGMDSSSIWAVARTAARQGDPRAAALKGYSFLYPGTASDEQVYIDENHRYWDTIGCYRDISQERICDSDEYLLSRQDYPLSGATAYVRRLLVQDLAAGGADTLLAGFSGDFWFNMPPLQCQTDLLRRGRLPTALAPLYSAVSTRRVGISAGLRWLVNMAVPRGSTARRLLRPPRRPAGMTDKFHYLHQAVELRYHEWVRRHGYAKAQMLYARETQWGSSYIPLGLVQLLASKGMVLRDPLGSRRVMEWALSVPPHEVAGRLEKVFMREAMSDLLPAKVRDKDFPTFHSGDLGRNHDTFRDVGDPRDWLLCRAGLLDAGALRLLWQQGADHYELRLERLVMSELFCRQQFT